MLTVSRNEKGEKVRVWDTTNGKEVGAGYDHTSSVVSAQFLPDNKRVLTASKNGDVRLWDVKSSVTINRIEVGNDLTNAQLSANEVRLLTSSWSETCVWETASGTKLFALTENLVGSAAWFSNDGNLIFSARDGLVRIWTSDGKKLCDLLSFRNGNWVVADPDGRFDSSSPDEIKDAHWILPDAPFTPVPIESFMREYYEPRLLTRILAGEKSSRSPRSLKSITFNRRWKS